MIALHISMKPRFDQLIDIELATIHPTLRKIECEHGQWAVELDLHVSLSNEFSWFTILGFFDSFELLKKF